MSTETQSSSKPIDLSSMSSEIKRDLSSYNTSKDFLLLVEIGHRLVEARKLTDGDGAEWSGFLDESGLSTELVEVFEKAPSAWDKYKEAILKLRKILLKALAMNTSRLRRAESVEDGIRFEQLLPDWIEYQEACLKERGILLEMLSEDITEVRYLTPNEDDGAGVDEPHDDDQDESSATSD